MATTDIGNLAGANGGTYIADTATYTPATNHDSWFCVYCVSNATFVTLTSNIENLPDNLSMTAGQAIYGTFTVLDLASGAVIAYYK